MNIRGGARIYSCVNICGVGHVYACVIVRGVFVSFVIKFLHTCTS